MRAIQWPDHLSLASYSPVLIYSLFRQGLAPRSSVSPWNSGGSKLFVFTEEDKKTRVSSRNTGSIITSMPVFFAQLIKAVSERKLSHTKKPHFLDKCQ